MTTIIQRIKSNAPSDWPWLALVAGLFAALLIFINPLREFGFNDDWAYALVVKEIVKNGVYQTNEWLPSFVPTQIYWGVLFSSILGYSFGSLHVSTVVLAVVGLVGFYFLAREFGIATPDACILCLIWLGSPLVLQYSVTFMTDIPFLAYLILSILFYTRGLKKQSLIWMILGGGSAALAIGTRLFGAAVIPGLGLVWLLSSDKRRTLLLIGAGLALPVLMLIWVILWTRVTNLVTSGVSSNIQMLYFSHLDLVAGQVIWRLMIALQYMAFFCAPILVPAFLEYRQRLAELRKVSPGSPAGRFELVILLGITLFILAVSLFGSFVLNEPGVMPIIKWNFFGMSKLPSVVVGLITLGTMVGAFLIGRLLILHYLKSPGWAEIPSHERVLVLITGCVLAIHLVLFELGDRYLIHLIPFILIVVGRGLSSYLARWRTLTLAVCLACMLVSALWVRQTVSRAEAQWNAADTLVADGVPPDTISGMLEWDSYYGAYHEFLVDLQKRGQPFIEAAPYFTDWLPARRKAADYLVFPWDEPPSREGWSTVDVRTYQDMLLRDQHVYVIKRDDPGN